jgi:hypothetical protein
MSSGKPLKKKTPCVPKDKTKALIFQTWLVAGIKDSNWLGHPDR